MADIDTDAMAESIADGASLPKSTNVDGTSTEFRDAADQIERTRYLERREAARRAPFGKVIRMNRPGTLD